MSTTKLPPVPRGDAEAITVVAAFLVHAERDQPDLMYGSWHVDEAIEAFAHLVGCTPALLRTVGDTK